MAKIKWEFETLYDIGDVVIFNYHNITRIGIIQSFYLDDQVVWYNILSDNFLCCYSQGGDIAEFDILGKITDKTIIDKIREKVADNS